MSNDDQMRSDGIVEITVALEDRARCLLLLEEDKNEFGDGQSP